MSITGINSHTGHWQRPNQQSRRASGSTMTTGGSEGTASAGAVSSNGNVVAYMQSFAADLQSMLTQMGNGAGASAAASTTASATSSSDPAQNPNAVHHHHHNHGRDGEGGIVDDAANQLVAEVGNGTQDGALSSGQINQSTSVSANNLMQALQSYASVAQSA